MIVRFTVYGNTEGELRGAAADVLAKFSPTRPWWPYNIDIDAEPFVRTVDGGITTWRADVVVKAAD